MNDRIEELEADLRSMSLDYLAASGQAQENFQMYVDANEARIDAEAKLDLSEGALDVALRSWRECQNILEQTEDKLAKAVKALERIGKTYTADKNRLIHGELRIIEMVQTALAELKGETDG